MNKTECTPKYPKRSQCQVLGIPQVRTWADYREGCMSTYGGGHHYDGHLSAFQHGMETIFRLLEDEFPPAEHIWACVNACAGINPEAVQELLTACKCAKAQIKKGAHKKALPILRAAIANATNSE